MIKLSSQRQHFDYIIINTPSVLPSATMGILAILADTIAEVIRAGLTPKHFLPLSTEYVPSIF